MIDRKEGDNFGKISEHIIISALNTLNYNHKFHFLAPLKLYGSGSFALSAVKQILPTEDFLGLNDDIKKCQDQETYEECTTRAFTRDITEKCLCTPFALRNFSDTTQVICKKIQYLEMVTSFSGNLFSRRKLLLSKC